LPQRYPVCLREWRRSGGLPAALRPKEGIICGRCSIQGQRPSCFCYAPVVRGLSMVPVIALGGRPNVGKSTLFNRLTRSRDAILADMPGLTRDRQYGEAVWQGRPFIVVDTGGLT